MSGFKGTPGPWQIGKSSRGDSILSIGPCIADEYVGLAWLDVTEEDAQLISAAPELLEALRDLLEQTGISGTYADKARAAIAKALGEQQ